MNGPRSGRVAANDALSDVDVLHLLDELSGDNDLDNGIDDPDFQLEGDEGSEAEDLVEEIDDEPEEIVGEETEQTLDVTDPSNEGNRSIASDDDIEDGEIQARGKRLNSKSGMVWMTEPFISTRRRNPENIIRKEPGLNDNSSAAVTIKDCFKLFVTADIVAIIVNETNRKAGHIYQEYNTKHPDKQKSWMPTNSVEIYAYIGLLLTLGALSASGEPVKMLWSRDPVYARPICSGTMSRDRFKLLTVFIRFDDYRTRAERRLDDKLAAIREVHSIFAAKCRTMLNPSPHVCVDEQLVGFRGRAPFRVYHKDKPDKYGLKIWILADTDSNYVHNCQVYLGKINNTTEVNQGKRVVLDLTEHIGEGHGVTADNFFTSIPLADELLEKKKTLCGTLKKNKREIPSELQPDKTREELSSIFCFTKQHTLVSYVPKKNKAVILLSTEHHDKKCAAADGMHKPEIILHYNRTKGGVDTTDQLTKKYSCKRRSLRWPLTLLYNLLDLASVNASTIWFLKHPDLNKKDRRRECLLSLGKALIQPHVKLCAASLTGLSSRAVSCMKLIDPTIKTKEELQRVRAPSASVQGRCFACPRNIDKKTRIRCETCNRFVCNQHSTKLVKCDPCIVADDVDKANGNQGDGT